MSRLVLGIVAALLTSGLILGWAPAHAQGLHCGSAFHEVAQTAACKSRTSTAEALAAAFVLAGLITAGVALSGVAARRQGRHEFAS